MENKGCGIAFNIERNGQEITLYCGEEFGFGIKFCPECSQNQRGKHT